MPSTPLTNNEAPIVKTVATTVTATSSTTLASITDLTVQVGVNATTGLSDLELGRKYRVQGVLVVGGDTAGDIKFQFSLPSGTTLIAGVTGAVIGGTTSGDLQNPYHDGTAATSFGTAGVATKTAIAVSGVVTVGTTLGSLALQWAQDTSSATASSVFAGSYLVYERLN